jgi:hypothetical protein
VSAGSDPSLLIRMAPAYFRKSPVCRGFSFFQRLITTSSGQGSSAPTEAGTVDDEVFVELQQLSYHELWLLKKISRVAQESSVKR